MQICWGEHKEIIRKDIIRCVYVVLPEETDIAYSIEYGDGKEWTRIEHFRNRADCMWRYRDVMHELTGNATDSPYFKPISSAEEGVE